MSSSRAAAIKQDRQQTPTKSEQRESTPALSADAIKLAAAIERTLTNGDRDDLTDKALQALMAAVCKAMRHRSKPGATCFRSEHAAASVRPT
jgi:lipoate synthase